jgi:undecaprenyl diphosphate synthase
MDGNGRWANQHNLPRAAGHLEGSKAVKRITVACRDLGIAYLTLYAFSTENWKRPQQEVHYLMGMIASKLHGELSFYVKHGIRILVRGDISKLPVEARDAVVDTMDATKAMRQLTCILAINYGGQDEICKAVDSLLKENMVPPISPIALRAHMQYPDIPPVDMICRSAGEKRLSNFLLWDSAYAELGFYDKLFPDWDETDIRRIMADFSSRTRKFGGLAT